jgi:aminoglycoside phosphotransferase (APT) family kinase protein
MSPMLINFNHYFQSPPLQKSLTRPEIQALLMHLGSGRRVIEITPLQGGFRNQNYHVDFDKGPQGVLKVATDLQQAKKAIALQQQLSRFLPVPKIWGERATSGHVFTLMEYVPGDLACHLSKDLPEEAYYALGHALGTLLSKVHSVQFPGAGFLNAQLEVTDPHANLGDSWLAYMREVMHGKRAEARLGVTDCQRVLHLLNAYEEELHALSPTQCLVHSDFNLKNILVQQKETRWKITGLLDWEFAHAGSPLVDIGNFYRFEAALPDSLFSGFAEGYGLSAIKNWRELSRVLDLAALCNFLDAPEELPLTQETAIYLIRQTLEALQSKTAR